MEARRRTDILPTLHRLQREISNCLENMTIFIIYLLLMKICYGSNAFFQHPNVGSCQSITMVHRVRGVSRGAAGGGLRGGGAGLNTTVAVLGTVTPTQHLTVQHS